MARHNEFGSWGEDAAADYLVAQGYIIKERDFRRKKYDIDIIALTPDTRGIVFVEVKTRTSDEVVDPLEAVTVAKMRGVGKCANIYLKELPIPYEPRFDIITIVRSDEGDPPQLLHIVDAFNPCLL